MRLIASLAFPVTRFLPIDRTEFHLQQAKFIECCCIEKGFTTSQSQEPSISGNLFVREARAPRHDVDSRPVVDYWRWKKETIWIEININVLVTPCQLFNTHAVIALIFSTTGYVQDPSLIALAGP